METVIGIDIGGTNLRIGAVNGNGIVSFFERQPTSSCVSPDILSGLDSKIREFIKMHGLAGHVLGISVGVPASVSKDKSFVLSSPNLAGLNNIDLGHELEKKLDIPVYIDRDVNYLLMNDINENNLDPDRNKNIVGIYFGTGIGNALYLNGQLFSGKNGVAGELGHIPLPGSSEQCSCGNIGCAETRISGKYLEKLCRKYFPTTDIRDVFTRHRYCSVIGEFVKSIAFPVSIEINILDPDFVILSGGVITMNDFPVSELLDHINMHLRRPYPARNIQFVFPEHTQTSGVKGGAFLVYKKLNKGISDLFWSDTETKFV
jgi:allose kinase